MKTVFSIILILCCSILLKAQHRMDNYFGVDPYGFLYYEKDNVFYKEKDQETHEYANFYFGKINSVDIVNPLQLIIYYRDTNQIVVLDNQCNEIRAISVSDFDFLIQDNHVGLASLKRLWIHNQDNNRILLYNWVTKTFNYITPAIFPQITLFKTILNYVFWIDTTNTLHRCDLFGNTEIAGEFENVTDFQIITEKLILYQKQETLYSYNLSTKKHLQVYSGIKSFSKFYYSNQILSIFTNGEISLNHINL